jgi:hypothetical protein
MSRSNCSTSRWASTPSRSDAQRAARTNSAPSSASLQGGQSHHAVCATTSRVSSPGNASRQRPQRRGGGGRSLGAAFAVAGLAGAAISARPANVARRERRGQRRSVRGAAQPVAGGVRIRDLEPTAPGPQKPTPHIDTGPDDDGLVVAHAYPRCTPVLRDRRQQLAVGVDRARRLARSEPRSAQRALARTAKFGLGTSRVHRHGCASILAICF